MYSALYFCQRTAVDGRCHHSQELVRTRHRMCYVIFSREISASPTEMRTLVQDRPPADRLHQLHALSGCSWVATVTTTTDEVLAGQLTAVVVD